MSRITFEIPQSRHPFIGLGTGIIITENGREEPKIIIKFPLHNIEIVTSTGDSARSIIAELHSDETFNLDRVEFAKNAACDILQVGEHLLHIKTKKEKPVFARWLVWYYAKNTLKMNDSECGRIFGFNRLTVRDAVKHFKPENVNYLLGWQRTAYDRFCEEMKNYVF
jgi:hypothetical protein